MHELQHQEIGELRIELHPQWGIATYIGTRMQLAAEGIIPDEFDWRDGFRHYYWETNGLQFSLFRSRPTGAKGPRRKFLDCDNWKLTIQQSGPYYDLQQQREIRLRERELSAIRHRTTSAGRREERAVQIAFVRAYDDTAFQAFKALIPALNPQPKNRGGRPRKACRLGDSA